MSNATAASGFMDVYGYSKRYIGRLGVYGESWVFPQPERIVFVIFIILSSQRYTSIPRSVDLCR
jgi:hypothetical protein